MKTKLPLLFLVSWKVLTCSMYYNEQDKLKCDKYGQCSDESSDHCLQSIVEKNTIFKNEDEMIEFVKKAPYPVTDLHIQKLDK